MDLYTWPGRKTGCGQPEYRLYSGPYSADFPHGLKRVRGFLAVIIAVTAFECLYGFLRDFYVEGSKVDVGYIPVFIMYESNNESQGGILLPQAEVDEKHQRADRLQISE